MTDAEASHADRSSGVPMKSGMTEPPLSRRLSTSDRTILSVAKGGGFLAAGSMFNYASRFVVALMMARVLGVDDYGAYNLSVSLAFVLAGLGNLGLDAAMERYIAVFSARGDGAGVRGTVRIGVVASTTGGILVAAAVYSLAPDVAAGIFGDRSLTPLFRLVALIVPVLVLTTLLSAAMRGFRRMDYSAFAEDFVQPLIRTVAIAGLAIVGFNAAVAVVVFGLSFVAALATLMMLLRRRLAEVTAASHVKDHLREISVFSFPFWLAGFLTQFRQNVQPVLLGVFKDVASVGIFSVASSANLISHTIYLSITKSLRPPLAELIDTGNRAEAERLYRTTTRWTLTISLPVFIVMVLYPAAILRVFGESFEAGATALVVLAFSELANAATGTCGTVIDMSGYNTVKVVNKFVWVGLSLGLNVLLIPPFGIMGAAVAVLLATATVQMIRVIEVWMLAGLNPYDRMILKPVAAAALAFAPGWAIEQWLIDSLGTLELLAAALAVGLVYVGALIILGLGDDDRLVLEAIWRRVRPWK